MRSEATEKNFGFQIAGFGVGRRMGLESVESKPQGTGSVDQSIVVTCERYGLTLLAEKFLHRRQVQGIHVSQPVLETAPRPA